MTLGPTNENFESRQSLVESIIKSINDVKSFQENIIRPKVVGNHFCAIIKASEFNLLSETFTKEFDNIDGVMKHINYILNDGLLKEIAISIDNGVANFKSS